MISERWGSKTQNRREYDIFLHNSLCVPRPWDVLFGGSLVFVPNQFLG